MKWRRFIPHTFLFFAGLGYAVWSFVRRPFPMLDENPLLDLVDYHTPTFYGWVMLWYYASPFVAVMLAGLILMSVWKVWLEGHGRDFATFGGLPVWPLSPRQKAPAIVIGEVHHPVEAREIFNPSWLTIPERGLYTGVAIFGAVGSGKTSACMHPFARQLLSWQAANSQMRAAALVLEAKGDFCHDIRRILADAGREKDYIELGMKSRWQWNPLSAWWLDSYSLAYTVSSLLNQLFGKGTVFVLSDLVGANKMALAEWVWKGAADPKEQRAVYSRPLRDKLDKLKLTWRVVWDPGARRRGKGEGGGGQALVCQRLANAGQQDQVLDCRRGFGVPGHVRHAGCGQGVLSGCAGNPR